MQKGMSEQDKADLKLGRLVRAMPADCYLLKEEQPEFGPDGQMLYIVFNPDQQKSFLWTVEYEGGRLAYGASGTTPEQALKKVKAWLKKNEVL